MPGIIRTSMAVVAAAVLLGACAETRLVIHTAKQLKRQQAEAEHPGATYKVGDPYKIDGVYYYPAVDYDYVETGIASWYGDEFHGRTTANGELFDMNALTAAHRTLPMPSMVRVVNLDNGRALTLRVNDRGPFARGRIIDVSRRAAQLLGFRYRGTARVRVEIMPEESRRLAMLAGAGEIAEADRIVPTPRRVRVVSTGLSTASEQQAALVDEKKRVVRTARSRPRTPPEPPAPARVAADAREMPSVPPPGSTAESVVELALDVEPVRSTALYVQAGSFVRYANAAKLRSRLAEFAPARVTEARVGEEKFFRVRLGPFQDLDRADRALAKVTASGYPRAQLIVD